MKTILTISFLILASSCATLGEQLSGVPTKRYSDNELKGKNPVEMKKILGSPVFEAVLKSKKGPLYSNWIDDGSFYALVYSTSSAARYAYNLNDNKECNIIIFYESKKFTYSGKTHRAVGKYCSPGLLDSHWNLLEMPVEKFWEKYGY